MDDGIIVQINSSWCTRVNRDDLLIFQVDGTEGSAAAGLRECKVQARTDTPRAVWNPDAQHQEAPYREAWHIVPTTTRYENAFKVQWEMFLRYVLDDAPFPHDFLQGARGVQLVDAGLRSWAERRWIDVLALQA
jgi:predicted dehydrogenase